MRSWPTSVLCASREWQPDCAVLLNGQLAEDMEVMQVAATIDQVVTEFRRGLPQVHHAYLTVRRAQPNTAAGHVVFE